MRRKLFCMALAIMVIIMSVPITTQAATPSSLWTSEGNYDTAWYDSSVNKYTLKTAAELAGLAVLVNNGADFSGKTVQLGNDIDISAHRWTAIGYYRNSTENAPFSGVFDGCEHTISGLTALGNYSALFGYIFGDTTIKNISVNEVDITGEDYLAGVVAYADADSGHIELKNCTYNGYIKENHPDWSGNHYIAGIVGRLIASNGTASIVDCESYGTVGCGSYGGGIVGEASGGSGKTISIENCHNYAYISGGDNSNQCGGIAGYAREVRFSHCSNHNDVYGNSTSDDEGSIDHGGIAGDGAFLSFTDCANYGTIKAFNAGGITTTSSATIKNCLNVGKIIFHSDLYGCALGYYGTHENSYYLSGSGKIYDIKTGVTSVTSEQLSSGEVCYLLNESTSEDSTVWKQTLGTDAYPSFSGKTVYYDADATSQYYNVTADAYEVELNVKDTIVSVDEKVYVTITADNPFAAAELSLTYDPDYLAFNASASTLNDASITNNNGTIVLADYGESQTAYTIAFDAVKAGTTVITLDSAAFCEAEDAAYKDLITAEIISKTSTIFISQPAQAVELPDILDGNSSVEFGEDYTFRINEDGKYYDYVVEATMNGTPVDVIDNGNGTYTVECITGKLVVSASRTPKNYSVAFSTSTDVELPDNDTLTYGTDYTFTLPTVEHYAISITEVCYATTTDSVPYSIQDGIVTIDGAAIIDNIQIVIDQVRTDAPVVVEGNGASDAEGYEPFAILGQAYTISVNKDGKYDYVVTATVNGESVELETEDDNYTISAEDVVDGTIVFTITKSLKKDGVSVDKYITLDGSNLWLITNKVDQMEDMVYCYDGDFMLWSEKYEAYCYLVFAETLSLTDVQAQISIVAGSAKEVDYGMDVNMTGKVDANDAQLVYDIYNAKYSVFTTDVTMEKFLRADVNGVDGVTVEDAAAIISAVLN